MRKLGLLTSKVSPKKVMGTSMSTEFQIYRYTHAHTHIHISFN